MDTAFTDFSARKLRQLTARLRECAGGLSTDELWRRATEEQNSIGNLLLHLAGNVRQWIVAGIGGRGGYPGARARVLYARRDGSGRTAGAPGGGN